MRRSDHSGLPAAKAWWLRVKVRDTVEDEVEQADSLAAVTS